MMHKIKQWTHGRYLWLRAIGSSVVGYLLDSIIFVLIAFSGLVSGKDLLVMIFAQYGAKMFLDFLPGTFFIYLVVALLRKLHSKKDALEKSAAL